MDGKAISSREGSLRIICLTQNIGAIDQSQKEITPDVMHLMVSNFVASMAAFLRSSAAEMHAKKLQCQQGANVLGGDAAADTPFTGYDIVVLHLQEIGGKKRNEHVMAALSGAIPHVYPDAAWCSGLLMSQRECQDTFSAMGCVIFVSKRIFSITSIMSFMRNQTFVSLSDDPATYVADTESSSPEKDLLFSGKKFSDAGSSRKGYMLTTIRVGTQVLNFVNVHMYHDEDNRVVVQKSPSEYALRRLRAWDEMLSHVLSLVTPSDPCFVFGDLNARLDGVQLMEFARTTFNLPQPSAKKAIDPNPAFWDYVIDPRNVPNLLKFDLEMGGLLNAAGHRGLELGEMPIQFPPSFTKEAFVYGKGVECLYSQVGPDGIFSKDRTHRPNKHERFPGFCDRVLMNPEALRLVGGHFASSDGNAGKPNVWEVYQYNSAVMDGTDHDCVYLAF